MKLIHPILIIRILSTILLIGTGSFLACIPVALAYNEPIFPFYGPAIITGIISLSLRFLTRKTDPSGISSRDSFLTVTIAWIIIALSGSLPYIISHSIPSFINAFFESASGFTTTGASILTDVESLPYSILFWRSLTHWIGGFGIVLVVILILPSLKVTGYQMFSLESSLKEKIHPKTKGITLRIMTIYFSLTLLEVIFLSIGDMNLFDSVCHSFATIATGGFSTKNSSLGNYSAYSQYIVMLFMFLAGTSQIIYYYLVKRNFLKVKHNEEFWFYLAIVAVSGAMAFSILLTNTTRTPEEAFREGLFQVISIITCTGFANDDFILWPLPGMMLIFLLMFAGGSTGSTSGGIKMARHLVVLKNVRNVFTRLVHPNTYTFLKLNGRLIDEKTNTSILSFVLLYIFVFVVSTLFVTLNGADAVTSASSVATCMAGIGPGFGTVGPMSNFSSITSVNKIALSFIMILGRLEIITVFILFGKSFRKL